MNGRPGRAGGAPDDQGQDDAARGGQLRYTGAATASKGVERPAHQVPEEETMTALHTRAGQESVRKEWVRRHAEGAARGGDTIRKP
jgi:hypothetical protein